MLKNRSSTTTVVPTARPMPETEITAPPKTSIWLPLSSSAERVESVTAVGADRVELYTEPYASAFARGEGERGVEPFVATARRAIALGLGVNAGHDLNRENLPLFLQRLPGVLEVSIGHALIADALEMGYATAVHAYLRAMVSP